MSDNLISKPQASDVAFRCDHPRCTPPKRPAWRIDRRPTTGTSFACPDHLHQVLTQLHEGFGIDHFTISPVPDPPVGTVRATIYARNGTDTDIRQAETYCIAQGWTLAETITDQGVSGNDPNRPGYQQLLAAIKNDQVDVVVTPSLTHLTRKSETFAEFEEIAAAHDVTLRTLGE